MDPIYILLAIIVVLIPIAVKAFNTLSKKCESTNTRLTMVETMLAIYLHHAGFDVPKVTKAIKENMSELEQNGDPTVGCIDVSKLYRDNGLNL